jgi:hypothetical protein
LAQGGGVTWVKLDDHFADHPKILGLSDAAYRAYVDGLCYCARYLTDGAIPTAAVKVVSRRRAKVTAELLEAGLWDQNGKGVEVHDYLTYQEPAATVLERRRRDSERKKRGKP